MGESRTFNLDAKGFQDLLQHLTSTPHPRKLMLEVRKNGSFVMMYDVSSFSLATIMDFANRWTPEGYEITVRIENH